MKNLTFVGIILLALAFLLYTITPEFRATKLFEPFNLMGILAGIGIGLIFGGIVGYISKGSAIREAEKKKEIAELRKTNERLEKQKAEFAKNEAAAAKLEENKNPQKFY